MCAFHKGEWLKESELPLRRVLVVVVVVVVDSPVVVWFLLVVLILLLLVVLVVTLAHSTSTCGPWAQSRHTRALLYAKEVSTNVCFATREAREREQGRMWAVRCRGWMDTGYRAGRHGRNCILFFVRFVFVEADVVFYTFVQ